MACALRCFVFSDFRDGKGEGVDRIGSLISETEILLGGEQCCGGRTSERLTRAASVVQSANAGAL